MTSASSPATPARAALLIVLTAGFWAGCSSTGTSSAPDATNGAGAAAGGAIASSSAPNAGAASGVSGAAGAATGGTAGAVTAGGASGSIAGAAGAAVGGVAGAAGGAPNGGAATSAGGSTAKGGAAGAGEAAGAAGAAGTGAAGANNCNLPATVGFQKDVQPFLTSSCGKGVGGGCHVTDGSKTSLGYDHAYDWITAFAHTGSCGGPPYVKRFEVVLAVITGANPATCPKSRLMPPPGSPMGTPLTTCQIAALQAWLAEPQVSQMHVPETDDTKNLYPAGPYLMPPFN